MRASSDRRYRSSGLLSQDDFLTCESTESKAIRNPIRRLRISYARYEQNVAQLRENRSLSSRYGAVRQRRALVDGPLACGRRERRLGVRKA